MGRESHLLTGAKARREKAALASYFDGEGRFARRHISGAELRARIDRLGVPYTRMAGWLGLTVDGLQKQMRGDRKVTPQTLLLFSRVEHSFMLKGLAPSWESTEQAKAFREEKVPTP